MNMTRILSLCIIGAVLLCCPGRAESESVQTAPEESTNDFSLVCMVEGDSLECRLRNITTDPIQYSNYTIGYHETIILERYNPETRLWGPVPWKDAGMRIYKGIGASSNNVKSVASGAIIPPQHHYRDGEPRYSFVVNLKDYELPESEVHLLRVTQLMGTMLGSDLPVWKGQVVSEKIEYRPNTAIHHYRKAEGPEEIFRQYYRPQITPSPNKTVQETGTVP
ncbi:MAG: hypothetical protein JJT75_10990 [Opitutales bacterium]|nr:hypothetical protein [Opitutales bacterium]